MRSLANLFSPPTPEKIAEKELQDMRLTLFQAERRLLEAQMQVDYYRNMIAFLEEVGATGVEGVADRRFGSSPQPDMPVLQSTSPARSAPGLATIPIVPSAA
ncbi:MULTISPECIES: hypothetical protein [Cupriavidus]|uniref:Uncharacterized protein n=1 Tax=Cupriavidus pauculus TaxID=82633 RepID=A0A3G8H5C1_9BURK|nr:MULTISPECIES: hypothetical protein [Cupriavidus]AZG15588.1 hypothetical protein EHF44_19115 [Cupriavidus pauculus]MDT6962004.1 hypothetical protein [Cupriavidus sp. SZY C1]